VGELAFAYCNRIRKRPEAYAAPSPWRAYVCVREGNFTLEELLGLDLFGQTIGIIGTGRIGSEVARNRAVADRLVTPVSNHHVVDCQ
jgi:lactate dehydrogenase-like 2-hydroxyacid dehydrogenase